MRRGRYAVFLFVTGSEGMLVHISYRVMKLLVFGYSLLVPLDAQDLDPLLSVL